MKERRNERKEYYIKNGKRKEYERRKQGKKENKENAE
jgi:hypothetical protein